MSDAPVEMPDADAGSLQYANLPDAAYDPSQDWRVAQLSFLRNQYGDFGPDQFGEFGPGQEATDG